MIKNRRSAFTLAEMMIVMLILTILLAAFAPLMTKKSKVDLSNPWRWAANNSDIYYGVGNTQTALIGKNSKAATDPNAHLFIQADGRPALTLGEGSNYLSLSYSDEDDALCFGGTGSSNFHCGNQSTSYGYSALTANSSGENNVAYGYGALKANTSGDDNIAVGHNALESNLDGAGNVAVGNASLHHLQSTGYADNNTALGNQSGRFMSGNGNTIIGHLALGNMHSGDDNALFSYNSVAIGKEAMYAKPFREIKNDVAIGYQALSGDNADTASGKRTSEKNVAIGNGALRSRYKYITYNVAIGDNALISGTGNTYNSVSSNIAIGRNALNISSKSLGNVDLYGNIAIGESSCTNIAKSGDRSQGNICIGAFGVAGDNQIFIGQKLVQKKVIILGRDVTSWVESFDSDIRLKNVKGANNDGLASIRKLKIFNFTYKADENKTPHVGVMAQDLQKVFPNAVTKGSDGYFQIRKEDMFYAAINAIKELDKMVQDLVAQVKTVAAQVAEHDAQIKALQKENKELKAKVQSLEKQNKSFEDRLKAIEKKL